MSTPQHPELVTLTDGGRSRDGIVFERLSPTKLVVAVIDRRRGPVLRTVHPSSVSQRAELGEDDAALQLLIKRTPHATGRQGGNAAGAQGARAAHTRGAAHRSTGR